MHLVSQSKNSKIKHNRVDDNIQHKNKAVEMLESKPEHELHIGAWIAELENIGPARDWKCIEAVNKEPQADPKSWPAGRRVVIFDK